MAEPKTYRNFIDGEWVESTTREAFEDRNPADKSEVIGTFQGSTQGDVDAAVEAARKASRRWRQVPAPKRAEYLFRMGEILLRRKEDYAREMTREMGKPLREARGDVQEAIDVCYHIAGEGRRLHGYTTPSELP
ncbi:MAG: aldehyde dehydrogenase family protein, partial [Acidobacteriota bacterium]